jgi:hypothetical protein
MPFQRLMEELDLPRTTAYMPFFQAAITMDDAGEPLSRLLSCP